jgi:hypothetical protein
MEQQSVWVIVQIKSFWSTEFISYINGMDKITLPAFQIPAYRTTRAVHTETQNNILFTTWGGIGDQICAEPTLRFAIDTFKDCQISLATDYPDLYRHLTFHQIFDLNYERSKIKDNDYLILHTIETLEKIPTLLHNDTQKMEVSMETLSWQFMTHGAIHCVDFTSLCALRSMLPVSYKEVILKVPEPRPEFQKYISTEYVFVHAGKHWPSKTFPEEWWNEVLRELVREGFTPVLIGKDMSDNRAYVDTITEGCVDLRNRLKLTETIWLLQNAFALVCNDSAPLHMAATGKAWIGYVATAKHPDYITHYRQGAWGWRMKNFGKGGMWDLYNICPNKKDKIEVDLVDPEVLKSWLPEPQEMVEWLASKKNS